MKKANMWQDRLGTCSNIVHKIPKYGPTLQNIFVERQSSYERKSMYYYHRMNITEAAISLRESRLSELKYFRENSSVL
jgi:hypothetical protein